MAFLQRVHLILPPAHHQIHHTAPFNKYYCITVGWLNKPLAMIGFFPMLERLVTWATGLLPRQDDIGTEAASRPCSRPTPRVRRPWCRPPRPCWSAPRSPSPSPPARPASA